MLKNKIDPESQLLYTGVMSQEAIVIACAVTWRSVKEKKHCNDIKHKE